MFSLFEKPIKNKLLHFLAIPGSVEILRNKECSEKIGEKIELVGPNKIILVGHNDCLAYRNSSRKRQHNDLRAAMNFCTANFRNADIVAIWAEIDEKENVRFLKITFREETLSFSPIINLSDI